MKHESEIRPTNRYEIENIKNDQCEVVFFDLNSIEEETRIDEEGNEKTIYLFNDYRENMAYNSHLDEYLDENYTEILNKVKQREYDKYAEEVRAKRNKLLEESDCRMAFDRLGFEIPATISMTNIVTIIKNFFNTLKNIKTGEWASYRQQLRDLPSQEGFPFNVVFPKKPEE